MSKILHETKLTLKRKTIIFRLYRNDDGPFLAIIEANGRSKNTIFIPADEYWDFLETAHDLTLMVSQFAHSPF